VTAAGGTISLLVGAVLLRLTVTDTYQRYVRVGMGTWLTVAGIAVLVLGAATLLQAVRRVAPVHAHDHDDHGGPGVGWLLLAPIAALLLVAPPTLGSYGVGRGARVDVRSGAPVFPPLHRSEGPLAMPLLEFGQRAFDHDGQSFRGTLVQLTGFVAGAERGGFRLARYQISCCAADAEPVVIDVVGTSGQIPPVDQWVTVTGTFRQGGGDIPRLAATSVTDIDPPNDPYE
jgi:uncharacterized repeat protein (TIGR03943 family)